MYTEKHSMVMIPWPLAAVKTLLQKLTLVLASDSNVPSVGHPAVLEERMRPGG